MRHLVRGHRNDRTPRAPVSESRGPAPLPLLRRAVPALARSPTASSVDVLSDAELNTVSAKTLAQRYKLLIFSGHHEYVTTHEYDTVTGFRDRGGNLMFLSANNFFWKITIKKPCDDESRPLARPSAGRKRR